MASGTSQAFSHLFRLFFFPCRGKRERKLVALPINWRCRSASVDKHRQIRATASTIPEQNVASALTFNSRHFLSFFHLKGIRGSREAGVECGSPGACRTRHRRRGQGSPYQGWAAAGQIAFSDGRLRHKNKDDPDLRGSRIPLYVFIRMSSEIIHNSTPASLHPLSPAIHPPAWPPLNKVNFLLVTCFLLFCRRKIQTPSIRVRQAQVFSQVASVCPITGQSLQLISELNQIAVL